MIIKNNIKIIISLLLIAVLAMTMYYISDRSNDGVDTSEPPQGDIYFKLYDEKQDLVIDDTLSFYKDDTLFTLMNRHYDLVCADKNYQADDTCSHKFIYGRILLGIEDVQTNWYDTVLSIYVNDSLSTKGVSLIELSDGDVITIRKTVINE
ncbi:MAG: DUF4430 domain-containing protein [Candidatus Izemoplasmatales bacterium]